VPVHLAAEADQMVQPEILLNLHLLHLLLHQAEDLVVAVHQEQPEDLEDQEVHREELEMLEDIHL
jgi:hypothetical protein